MRRQTPGPRPKPASERRTARMNLFFTPPRYRTLEKLAKEKKWDHPADWASSVLNGLAEAYEASKE